MMDGSLILALDIGTSSARASLYDGNAKPVPGMSAKIDRALETTADGGSEIDADEAFDQVVAAVDAVHSKAGRMKGEIGYVATSAFWHSLVGVDAKGKPTTKVFSWADMRSRKYSEVLRKRFDETAIHNRTGARFHSSYWPAKLLWLRQEFPDVFARTAQWLSFSDYISLRLFSAAETSVSMASGTGIFDIRGICWDNDLVRFLKINPDNLPKIVEDDPKAFKLTKSFAKRWPRLKNANWFPAIADGAADNIGSGCVTKAKAALMIGTSGAMRVAYEGEPPAKIPDGLWCYRIGRKRVVIGGALSDGGGLNRWLEDNLKLPKDAEEQIARRKPTAHGLAFLPFLAGERSTGYNESATGAIIGLRSSTDSIDILQAAMESVAFRFAEIFDQLNSVVKIREIVASGGALRASRVWTQIIADVLGRDLTLGAAEESSSRGAVLLVLDSIGKIENIENLPTPVVNKAAYRPKYHPIYKLARKQHCAYYASILNTNS